MSQSNDAPREWWIDKNIASIRPIPNTPYEKNSIHVIEHAAYQSAIAELNRVRDLLTRGEHSVIKERDELKAELDKFKLTGRKINPVILERDELRAKLDVARAALEDIKTSGGRASIHGLDILRCPTCASAELACEALDKLNEELKK